MVPDDRVRQWAAPPAARSDLFRAEASRRPSMVGSCACERCREALSWTKPSCYHAVGGVEPVGPICRISRTGQAGVISRETDCGGRASRPDRYCDVVRKTARRI